MAILRQKSGKPNAAEYQRPVALQKFRALARSIPGGASEHELAQLTVQLQNYMEDHFGRYSSKPRLITRLPASLFRDLREDGAVAKILRITLNYKREMKWSEIEFKNPAMQEGIQGLFLTLEHELKQMNLLKHPRVHFHSSVPPDLASTLSRILRNYAGEVVPNAADATHLVQFDPEVDGGAGNEIEADYLRTLKMQPEDGIAFVHWWYYPDSYDEWIPLQDVEGQPPDEDELNRKPKQWRVCCRFIRDVEIFNEWGNELDYEVDDDNADDASGDKKKKSEKNKNKAKKQEELARKRKEGVLPEFIETTSTIMPDEPRPTENATIKHLRVAEMHNGNQVVETGAGEAGNGGVGSGGDRTDSAMQITESNTGVNPPRNGVDQHNANKRFIKPSTDLATSGRKRYRPTVTSTDAMPEWFEPTQASPVERRYLPEYFDGQSKRKTPERYIEIRNMIISLYKQNPDQYLFATDVRKQLPADACAALRIHELLDSFGIINNKLKTEQERPQDMFPTILNDTESEDLISRYQRQDAAERVNWSEVGDAALLQAVAKYEDNWEKVASEIGGGVKPKDCLLRFCEFPIQQPESGASMLPNATTAYTAVDADPNAVEAACTAAWTVLKDENRMVDDTSTSTVAHQASQATAAGVVAANARSQAQRAQQVLNHMVDDYIASRLQSLEQKAKSLDEMEKWVSIENEKVELERRDLYIQRAKHALNVPP